ncbi:hypothetical protein [Zymomonas mobilis]|uniref:Uncharacterized protein n=1 Tax=Zymomonas mobilis subsp. pomaceae (strain ATCC 29192 / DSM 22645 / JCM 10191 / CCUG 17912 / NBRC 13757 / NCIMB 11200 / NRRL B-4491 / Barker I) TaxID=579138 RepID=F8ETF9_ZYMMT|nr:hypothetical protein [Zymomonas mobilis]AEI37984.1 hypothetical protein Zymop_1088 [Zymomonas mobilis subsp. pomaceae ATCC 29192]MDX5949352.1 hypothetical protein [Zymomonas mobilis subsp. pomaceae]GEB89916.1 hypothetical protein ZMO02_15530 [Zymomonas mobilis subsp. pomaceae]
MKFIFCNEACKIWEALEKERYHTNRNPEAITKDFLSSLQINSRGKVRIHSFDRETFNEDSSDLEIWIKTQKKWFGILVKTKLIQLNNTDDSYPELNRKIDGNFECDLLIKQASSRIKKVIPFYFFYNFTNKVEDLNCKCYCLDKFMYPGYLGITAALATDIRKKIIKNSEVKNISAVSFPALCLFCPNNIYDIKKVIEKFNSNDTSQSYIYDTPPDYVNDLLINKKEFNLIKTKEYNNVINVKHLLSIEI